MDSEKVKSLKFQFFEIPNSKGKTNSFESLNYKITITNIEIWNFNILYFIEIHWNLEFKYWNSIPILEFNKERS